MGVVKFFWRGHFEFFLIFLFPFLVNCYTKYLSQILFLNNKLKKELQEGINLVFAVFLQRDEIGVAIQQ